MTKKISYEENEKLEKEFLEAEKNGDFKPVSEDKKQEILKAITETKKSNKSISLRVNEHALNKFKARAEENGWNYQSVISAFIVQYANGKVHLD